MEDTQQFKNKRNAVVKLIKIKKKEYYENKIDQNKDNSTSMWKTLKEVIRGEPVGAKTIENIDFEILDKGTEGNIADKFNLYYIQSVNDIIKSIDSNNIPSASRKTSYVIENKGEIGKFEIITMKQLEEIVKKLPKKKGTEKGITSDILKAVFHVIKEEFSDINKSLSEGCFPEE